MSMNNILLTATNPPTHRYAKTIPSKLSGLRLDPVTFVAIPFVLHTPNARDFVYDDAVIELYSDREHRHFLQVNRAFIKAGFLKEYHGEAEPEDLSNIISDEEVEQIASIRTVLAMKARLKDITSPVTVDRVLSMAKHIGRPASIITLIQQRLEEM
jgi:hypothetical protein